MLKSWLSDSKHCVIKKGGAMLCFGTNIQSAGDKLTKVKVEYLYYSLRNPKPAIENKIRQLLVVKDIDPKQYGQCKRQLPYLVCAKFNPPIRRTENFAYIDYFILDIDHLSEKQLDLKTVRTQIQQDSRVLLCFASPSHDGLKVLFKLKKPCYDAGLYKVFYKEFTKRFALQYQVEQAIDGVTCDVSRACFISIDREAYYNEKADPVDLDALVGNMDSTSLFDLKRQQDKEEKESSTTNATHEVSAPDDEAMGKIKNILLEKRQMVKREVPPVYVPEELDQIMNDLKNYIEASGAELYEVVNISYAKKLRIKAGSRLSEINLFYGKHGFKVVQSPRTGTNPDLNKDMAELIELFLIEREQN